MSWDQQQLGRLIGRMAVALDARLADRQPAQMVGIASGGVWVAQALNNSLATPLPMGELNPAFYRDDFDTRGLKPAVTPSRLPFEVDGRHIVLVDDVLMTGRTIRAALNELFDFGRPASITLVVLFDVGNRELPIQADICGEVLALAAQQRVELRGPEPLLAEIRETILSEAETGTDTATGL